MLGRLVAKMMFKACVPLVAVAGVMTYGVYLKGGDPVKLWTHVGAGAFGQAGDMFSKAKNDAVGLAENLTGGSGEPGGSGATDVFTWKDAEGVTHFGTTAPTGVNAETLSVNPNINVLTPVSAPPARVESRRNGSEFAAGLGEPHNSGIGSHAGQDHSSVRALEQDMGEPLPGVAGQLLSNGAASGNGVDAAQLIRLLQSAGQ
ncbi:MAG: DUF4124 domain-containing protein [Granulosicoccus sp.]